MPRDSQLVPPFGGSNEEVLAPAVAGHGRGVHRAAGRLSGTAVALPGKNTVDSGDLKKNSVKAPDIARNAVTGPKIRNGAVTRRQIRNGTVNGQKVRDDSLTGTDLNESTLGQVPSANTATTATNASNADALGGVAPSGYQRAAQWVLVQPDGTIAAQSGGITVTKAVFPGNSQWISTRRPRAGW
jgi:hypothetical protein